LHDIPLRLSFLIGKVNFVFIPTTKHQLLYTNCSVFFIGNRAEAEYGAKCSKTSGNTSQLQKQKMAESFH
jgi:hypothetical protein